MKVRAQMGMVSEPRSSIGCHTCSVTWKNVWTSWRGMEYVWFNNVETKLVVAFRRLRRPVEMEGRLETGPPWPAHKLRAGAASTSCSTSSPTRTCRNLTITTTLDLTTTS